MSEPTDDKIIWYHNAPERSSIKSFSTSELVAELCKREGVTNYYENHVSCKHRIIVVRE